MTERYVIRVVARRRGLRHTQFMEINADSKQDAEQWMHEVASHGKVIGTLFEVEERVSKAQGRQPTGEELEWAKDRAKALGLTTVKSSGPSVDFTWPAVRYKKA